MYRCLVSIAQHEFSALVRDTKSAISGLKRQRESVRQAIEAARRANERPGHMSEETAVLIMRLLDRLQRLNVALDQVICEVEQIEATPDSASAEPFIVLPLQLTQAPNGNHLP